VTLLVQRVFGGEVPRLPADLLPENQAQEARNVDVTHGELRGMRGAAAFAAGLTVGGRPVKSAYTEDGVHFFAWAEDVSVVRSQVVDDTHYRIYYSVLYDQAPIIKVARTARNNDGVLTPVIGSGLVGGNWQPPENSPGPDSWLLGVPAPRVQADVVEDNLGVTLDDRPEWPDAARLQLRVTYFLEDPAGQIVAQQDVSNTEAAAIVNGATYPQVAYTNDSTLRGNKVQDMLWPLGYTPRPYKYYWLTPPDIAMQSVGRTVVVNNTGNGPITITYGNAVVDPGTPAGGGGGNSGNEAGTFA
jgi:hypothetical protein